MKLRHRFIIVMSFIVCFSTFATARKVSAKKDRVYLDYIQLYRDIAISNMVKYRIPASITLGQGLLESQAGQSLLTMKSNNHFGIKCHDEWTGKKVYWDDDERHECFRKYKEASYSFADHSRFLSNSSRYHFLFSLNILDYKGWARGLKNANYATDPSYANKLIKIIEDYQLYRYDRAGINSKEFAAYRLRELAATYRHTPYLTSSKHVYIIAKKGDTYESLADEFHFKEEQLRKYNEAPIGFPLKAGDIIYFQNKHSKADKPHYMHVVKAGESMYRISQLYDMKVHNLFKINHKDVNYVPFEGDVLKLR